MEPLLHMRLCVMLHSREMSTVITWGPCYKGGSDSSDLESGLRFVISNKPQVVLILLVSRPYSK